MPRASLGSGAAYALCAPASSIDGAAERMGAARRRAAAACWRARCREHTAAEKPASTPPASAWSRRRRSCRRCHFPPTSRGPRTARSRATSACSATSARRPRCLAAGSTSTSTSISRRTHPPTEQSATQARSAGSVTASSSMRRFPHRGREAQRAHDPGHTGPAQRRSAAARHRVYLEVRVRVGPGGLAVDRTAPREAKNGRQRARARSYRAVSPSHAAAFSLERCLPSRWCRRRCRGPMSRFKTPTHSRGPVVRRDGVCVDQVDEKNWSTTPSAACCLTSTFLRRPAKALARTPKASARSASRCRPA